MEGGGGGGDKFRTCNHYLLLETGRSNNTPVEKCFVHCVKKMTLKMNIFFLNLNVIFRVF